MKLSKIAFAVASTLVIASGAAFAGQIGSSSVTLATEVIYSDAQIVRAPSNVYSFAGDINAVTNTQRLQLQYSLTKGTWNVGTGQFLTSANSAQSLTVGGGLGTLINVNYNDATNSGQAAFPANSTGSVFVTSDLKTLVFNLTIPAGANNLLRSPSFTINAPAFVAGTSANIGINGLFTVAGTAACFAPDASADISFKHFTTHNGNTDVITVTSPDSEHIRVNSTNQARLLNFTQNHIFTLTPATSPSRQDAATLNTKLSGQNFAAVTTGAANNTNFLSAAFVAAQPGLRHYLGKAAITQRAQGLDTNYANIYGDNGTVVPGAFLEVADFSVPGAGNLENGTVEAAANGGIVITFPAALPTGANVVPYKADGNVQAAGDFVVTYNAARTVATVTAATTAGLGQLGAAAGTIAGFTNGVPLFLEFTGTNTIPQLTGITAVSTLAKTQTGANREQNVVCPGAFTGIGGGIKIDIRNYASRAKFPAGDFASYVRLINNSESSTADLFAQLIYADGTYGPWGALPGLAPRAVVNYSNAQLEALLTNTPAVTSPFGASTVYTQTAGTSVANRGVAGTGDRVRFLSNTGTTLRVQSFMLLPTGNLLDTTNAQGIDFENTDANRTPLSDGQPISQDAINGIAR